MGSHEDGSGTLAVTSALGKTAAMNSEEEQRALETVIERLAEYFPDTERAELVRVVDEEHHKLDGNPVRDYIAVLVEHASHERLRDEGHIEVLPPRDDSGAPPRELGDRRSESVNQRLSLGGALGGSTE